MSGKVSPGEIELYKAQAMGGWSGAASAPASQQSLWALIDDRLRGRWKWMLLVGAVLAVVFGVVGYRSTGPTYLSRGSIRIAPCLPQILESIPETRQIPFYQSFVATQVQYIRGRRVLEHAMENERLKSLEWAGQPNLLGVLENGLEVESDRNSELIFISYEAGDPRVAQTACNAIIESYDEIHGRADGAKTSHALLRLYDLKSQLERDLRTVRSDIQGILARHHTADLRELHSAQAQRAEELEEKIAAAELALKRLAARGVDGGSEAAAPLLHQLEAIDSRLTDLRQRRDAAVTDFEFYRQRYRPGSPVYARARSNAETAERLFEAEYARALEQWETLGLEAVPTERLEGFFDGLPPARLKEELDALKRRVAAMREKGEQLIADIQLLAGKEFEAERTQADLDRTVQRISGLELEGESIASRISVVQEATWPHSAYRDGRQKRAVAGAVFGLAVSFGVFFVIGTVDRRAYGAGQLRSESGESRLRCLGVLPDLGRQSGDAESGEVASHCVHQIRNQIEMMRDAAGGFVLVVSSPFQGDGKTSIVMALGWSYAAAGVRTLLIDCDLVGRSLTRQLGMVGREGLKEAVLRGSTTGRIASLPVEQLSVLPVGVDRRLGPEGLRRRDLEGVFEAVRDQYDVVIVDTGPLLGSLESTPVIGAADAVVLALKRGRSRTRLGECARRIEAAGTRCIGVILNGVGRSECSRYVSEASIAEAEAVRRGAGARSSGSEGQTAPGEGNALVVAMEHSARGRGQGEGERGAE